MPVLSQYWFADTDFRGTTTFLSISHSAGDWAWINWADSSGRDSTLVRERRDDEIVVPLAPAVNTPNVVNAVDGILTGDASRASDIHAGWIPWKHVPYRGDNTGAHNDYSLLVRVWFNFHVGTPWYCTDADGSISYYLFPWLDRNGTIRITVDGWSYDFDGGAPFCSGAIKDSLEGALPSGVDTVQRLLNQMLELFARRRFSLLYLLPGNGEASGSGATNVNNEAALAVLP